MLTMRRGELGRGSCERNAQLGAHHLRFISMKEVRGLSGRVSQDLISREYTIAKHC